MESQYADKVESGSILLGMTQTLSALASQLVARLALALVLALLVAAAPSLIDAWHDGGPVEVVLRLAYVFVGVIRDIVYSAAP